MLESAPKVPNTSERVEVVSSDITEDQAHITFTFNFARKMSDNELEELYRDTNGMFHEIIFGKLREKRWTEPAEKGLETALVPFGFEFSVSRGGKTWTMRYKRSDLNV